MSLKSLKDGFQNKELDKWSYIEKMYDHHKLLLEYGSFIEETNISGITIADGQVVMEFRDSGVKFLTAGQDKRLASLESVNFGSYELDELAIQLRLIDPGTTVFDIGGNFGWYACHVAKKFPTVKVLSFEPIPDTYKYLQKNVDLNSLSNIEAFPIGFSEQKGSFEFFYDPALSVNASLKNVAGTDKAQSVTCNVETVDKFVSEKNLQVDFIKCDVEGAELLVFKGAKEAIQKFKPVVFSEMLRKWTSKFDYHPNDIIHFFRSLGYSPFVIGNDMLKPFTLVDDTSQETNYVFLHDEKHKTKIENYSRKR